MKNTIKLVALSLVALFALASCNNTKVVIEGDIKNLEDQQVILSADGPGGVPVGLDTVQSKDGKFKLETKTEYPNFFTITFFDIPETITVYTGGANVKVEGELAKFDDAKITGSKSHDFLVELDKNEKEVGEKFSAKLQEYGAASEKSDTAAQNKIRKEAVDIKNQYVQKTYQAISKRPEELMSMFVLMNIISDITPEQVKEVYQKADPVMIKDHRLEGLKKTVEEIIKLSKGEVAPAFELASVSDTTKKVTLANVKGAKTAIFVTDTESEAAVKGAKTLKAAQAKNKDLKLIFVIATFPGMEQMANDYITKQGLEKEVNTFPNDKFFQDYQISSQKVILIGKDGKIIGSEKDVDKLSDLLDK